jgi:UDP-N-acetylmuramyl pentapeptide synthase
MKFDVAMAALVMGARESYDGEITGYSIDSRTLQHGDLFFALRGPNFDGHAFVPDVLTRGAAALWWT